MITGSVISGIKYVPGQMLSSKQERLLTGNVTSLTIPVGASIIIPDNMKKLIITERFGQICIDRVFITYRNRKDWVPVYMKIYDRGTGHLMLFIQGINYLVNNLTDVPTNSHFLKDVILSCAVNELYAHDVFLHELVKERFDIPSLSNICNDDVVQLANSESNSGYPWNTTDLKCNRMKMHVAERSAYTPLYLANNFSDLSLRIDVFDESNNLYNPLFDELNRYIEPHMGDMYSQIIGLDKITHATANEPEVDIKQLYGGSYKHAQKEQFQMADTLENKGTNRIEMLTSFSSDILQLCVWVHSLPVCELHLTYTLPKRTNLFDSTIKTSDLTIHTATFRNAYVDKESISIIELDTLFRFWDNEWEKISLIKTAVDELYLILEKGSDRRIIGIDLTITALLSQSVSRFD